MFAFRRLSDLVSTGAADVSRRRFMGTLPVLAATVAAACGRGSEQEGGEQGDQKTPPRRAGAINSDSRLDTALVRPEQAATSSTTATELAEAVPFHRYDPALPPLAAERTTRLHFRALETPVRISPHEVVAAWTFEGDVPGPIVHVRQGDTVEFTLTNEGAMPHSMDFHAAQLDPRTAFRSVVKGESVFFTFRPRHAGAFMYHCGTGPVLMHIGSGMYGAIIVDPVSPLPAAREFVLVQGEYYLSEGPNGIATCDFRKMAQELPDFVTFNGRPDQYVTEPIVVRKGERVRFYVVTAGPTHGCSFHVVGEQFDSVHLAAPTDNPLRGVQTFMVPPGGGMIFDLLADVAGEFPFVNHAFGHGQKGAIGVLRVEE